MQLLLSQPLTEELKKSQPFGSPKKRKVRISKEFPIVIPVQISEFLKNVFFKWSRDRFYKRSSSFGPRKNFDIYMEGRVKLLVFPLKNFIQVNFVIL